MLKFGCIADDLTGATDVANEIAANGMRALLVVGDRLESAVLPTEIDAVVVALKSRSIDRHEAVRQSLAALDWLKAKGVARFYFKYCSTFDSTPAGNIGPVLEAIAAALGTAGVVVCPAFPAAGRTVYNGHLFVGKDLLSESGMRHHPVTPMTDSSLVRLLQAQVHGTVELATRARIAKGDLGQIIAEARNSGKVAVVTDAIDDADLRTIGEVCSDEVLASGGSGLGGGIARALSGQKAGRASVNLPAVHGRRAIVAGSCSQATRAQVAKVKEHFPSFRLRLTDHASLPEISRSIRTWIEAQDPEQTLLIYSTADPTEVEQTRAAWQDKASDAIERILGQACADLVDRGVRALIVAGGETSGAAIRALECAQIAIADEIAPGVPWTIAATSTKGPLLLALKSGNFGGENFFVDAWETLT